MAGTYIMAPVAYSTRLRLHTLISFNVLQNTFWLMPKMTEPHDHGVTNAKNKSGIGHFPANFSIRPTKINFDWPNFLHIFNETAV